jgi:2-(1,2-epoxy-1,2-dihydrophenyl)acetyl-CoA isomerase
MLTGPVGLIDVAREVGMGEAILRVRVVAETGAPVLDEGALNATTKAVRDAGADTRAVLLTHPGKNFCLGGDVTRFAGDDEPGRYVFEIAGVLHETIRALTSSPLPVVAAVQGWAAGAGMSVACAADVVVAGESTQFRAAYPAIGFTPDGGLTWHLPRIVGRARALDLMLTNRPMSAPEALAAGLVSKVVADGEVQAEAEAIARALAAGSSGALAGVKRLVADGLLGSLDTQLDAERASISARADSADGREGVRAFSERRAPDFGG